MRKILMFAGFVGLAACNDSATVKQELDTLKTQADSLVKKIENSEVMDSVKSKGGKLLDSVKSKGGRLLDNAEKKFSELKKKDSSK